MNLQSYIRAATIFSTRWASPAQQDLLRSIRDHYKEVFDPYPYRRYMRKNQCIFIHIPKAAGTSVHRALGYHGPRDHCTFREYQKANTSRFNRYYKFTVVRDPVARFLSIYSYMRSGGNRTSDVRLVERMQASCSSITDFIALVEEKDLCVSWPMLWPQAMYIADEMGTVMVDDVLRVEKLSADFERVRERLELKTYLGHENRSQFSTSRGVYTPSELASVERFVKSAYEMDYRIIGI